MKLIASKKALKKFSALIALASVALGLTACSSTDTASQSNGASTAPDASQASGNDYVQDSSAPSPRTKVS